MILGDQLSTDSAALTGIDPARDVVWMAEADDQANYVWSSKPRIAVFLSAMRHFHEQLERDGLRTCYRRLDDTPEPASLTRLLEQDIRALTPREVVMVRPGEHHLAESLTRAAGNAGAEVSVLPDRHFLCSLDDFRSHAEGRKQLRMEYFYRQMRREHDVLLNDGEPVGGRWNFDRDNRERPESEAMENAPPPVAFEPDEITREVLELVADRFADHPGRLDHFDWPVTPSQADQALRDFVTHRLGRFGPYQDTMWTGAPFLYHSRLSSAMNLKLLDPRDALKAAEDAYHTGDAPLQSVEGFIRQVLGWREYVQGVYWLHMPEYIDSNFLDARRELPAFYWTGEVPSVCLAEAIGQTLEFGYAHHIQRLMITGLFALLAGVHPRRVHEWYLAVYVDAVEWVELPNTLGMSQFGDGGIMASKPYAASGKYIDRMSNYCGRCPYDPAVRTGEQACPFTTLYWDFLMRNRRTLRTVGRMGMQLRNLDRLDKSERNSIRNQADKVLNRLEG